MCFLLQYFPNNERVKTGAIEKKIIVNIIISKKNKLNFQKLEIKKAKIKSALILSYINECHFLYKQ